MTKYFINIGIAFSQFVHTLFGGDTGITLCSQLYIESCRGKKWAKVVCNLLSCFEKDHCLKSLEGDLKRSAKTFDTLKNIKIKLEKTKF